MAERMIEQALYGSRDAGGYRFLARSPGFRDEWLPEAQRLCAGFGERPAGVTCPAGVFAQPLGKRHVAVVQVADQGTDDAGRPGALGFHLLVLPRAAYRDLGGDPFAVAERFPPPWPARGELPVLSWPGEPPPARTVQQVQRVLQRADGPNLLGGAQALVDGGRLVFERPAPDPGLVAGLWTLLPTSLRGELWPASFAFGNALGFHVLVVPRADGEAYAGYLGGEQAGDYPEGRYELNLQIAAEAGDQGELDLLFARRTSTQTLRYGLILLALLLVVGLALKVLTAPPPRGAPAPRGTAPGPRLELPPPGDYPTLNDRERRQLTLALRGLAERLGVPPQPDAATAETWLQVLDEKLGSPDARRDPGWDLTEGPVQRRLRALLWKHGVAEYRQPGLNPEELVERLGRQVLSPSAGKEPP